MPEPLTWVFQIRDQMSGPAKQIVINLNAVVKATDDVKKKTKEAGHSMGDVFKGIGLERVAEKVLEVGKHLVESVIDMNRFATQTKIAFEVMLGSAGLANETFLEAKRVAFELGAPVEQVAASYKEMLSAGESVDNLQAVAKAASDLSHFEGGSIESWTKAFSNILGKGELGGRSLAAFVGAVDFDVLAKKLGLTTHGYKELTQTLQKTPVSAFKGVQAILQTLQESEAGKIGTISKKVADTFSGTITSIKEQFMDLFEFDSGDSPVLEFLHGVRDALKPGSPLIMGIREGAKSFMEGLGIMTGPGGFEDLVKSLKDGSVLGGHFKETMHDLGRAVHYLVQGLELAAKGIAAVGSAFSAIDKVGYAWMRGHLGSGVDMSQEAREFIWAKEHPDSTFASGMKGQIRSSLPPEEPSLQETLAAAIQVPHMASGGRVTGPTLALIGEGGEPETVVPDSKLGGMGARINLNLEQHFHVHGSEEAPVRELAGDLHALGLGDFQGALDTLASIAGAR